MSSHKRTMCRDDLEEILMEEGYNSLTVRGGMTKPLNECPMDQLIAIYMKITGFSQDEKPIALETDSLFPAAPCGTWAYWLFPRRPTGLSPISV